MVSSNNRLEVSLLTGFLAIQRYQPVWLRLTLVMLITLLLLCAMTEMLPLRGWCCHTYWMGPVPFSRWQRIHIVDPSTGDASLIRRKGLLTGTVLRTESHMHICLLSLKQIYNMQVLFCSNWNQHQSNWGWALVLSCVWVERLRMVRWVQEVLPCTVRCT